MIFKDNFRIGKVSKFIMFSFFIIVTLHAEEVASDDEIIENLEFLQHMELMESEMSVEEMEELDSVENVGLLGETK